MSLRAKRIIEAIAISLTVVSCVKDVILDAGDEPQVVVDCILTDEPVQTLYLVYTKGASREKAPELPEASAMLTDLTEGREAGRFERAADGSWQLNYAAIPAHEYHLDVTVPDHEPIWAEQTMPETQGVEVTWHSWDLINGDNNVGYSFRFLNSPNPVWFYGINYPTMDSPGEQTEYLFTDSEAADPFNEDEKAGSFEGNLWGDNSSGFRITSYPNLRNVPPHKRFLRLQASENTMGDPFYVSGSFQGYISDHKNFMHAELHPAELHYFSASEDYDRFIRDSYHLLNLKASSDLADIFIRDNVYSNIHGAIGLFGAKIERVLEWEGKDTWQEGGYFVLPVFLPELSLDDNDAYNFSQNLNEVLCLGRPFELLHYEYYLIRDDEYPDSLPDWSPEFWPGYDPEAPKGGYSHFYFDVIQNQEELEASGLGDCGEIDFSKKKVLVCAITFINGIPILIGYGRSNRHVPPYYWPESTYAPIILRGGIFSGGPFDSYTVPFRCALLVDKDDRIVDNQWFYTSFVYSYVGGKGVDVNDLTEMDMYNIVAHLNSVKSLAWNYP